MSATSDIFDLAGDELATARVCIDKGRAAASAGIEQVAVWDAMDAYYALKRVLLMVAYVAVPGLSGDPSGARA